jgi:uncharacterized protein YqhQ
MSEPLFKSSSDNNNDDEDEPSKHDGFDVFGVVFGKLNIWVAMLLFVLFVIINTPFFIEDVLKKINNNFVTNDGNPTSNGTMVQGVFLCIGYIIIDLLVSNEIL